MSESDELRRLGEADPVRGTQIPSADAPAQRALSERIMGMDTHTSWLRTRAGALTAAAVVAILTATGIVVATGGSDPPADIPGPGPITPPGSALCVELYSLDSIPNRETAFDGTVGSVAGDEVTFSVGEWFKGGSEDQVTLQGASTLGGITSAGDPLPLEPGTRLLVAGDDGFAWGCGFTQLYSPDVAADWRTALD